MTVNSQNIKEIREELNNALRTVTDKYGLQFTIGSISYGPNNISFTCRGTTLTEEDQFTSLCREYGFRPEDYRKSFRYRNKTYVLTGFDPHARSYPYIIQDTATGKTYKGGHDVKMIFLESNPRPAEKEK